MRGLLGVILCCFVAALSPLVFSDVVIVAPNTPHANSIAGKIKERIPKSIPVRIITSFDGIDSEDVVVPLGNKLYIDSISTEYNILPAFISFADFASNPRKDNIKTVLYSDPSPKSIANFLNQHFKNAKIGYVYSSNDEKYMQLVREALENKNQLVTTKHDGNTFTSIKRLIKSDIDVIFIGRNRNVYTRNNIRFVLDSLFRKNIPVLTSSRAYVKAGASVSISPNEDKLIDRAALTIERLYKQKDHVFTNIFIDDSKVSTNAAMMDFYNLSFREESE